MQMRWKSWISRSIWIAVFVATDHTVVEVRRAAGAPADPVSELVIGQFNMAGGNDSETGNLSENEAPDALLDSIRTHHPSFVTIEEACRDWSEYMDAKLADYTVAFHPVVGGNGQIATCKHSPKSQFGNSIIYRNDLGIDSPPVAFPLGSPPGEEQREMLCVSSVARKIVVCAVHLSSDEAAARRSEAANARKILASKFAGYITFVGADLNDGPLSEAAGNFYDVGYGSDARGTLKEVDSPCGNDIASAPSRRSSHGPPGTCRSGESTQLHYLIPWKIDYLFVSKSVFVKDADVTSAKHSDHEPLWATVTINKGSGAATDNPPPSCRSRPQTPC